MTVDTTVPAFAEAERTLEDEWVERMERVGRTQPASYRPEAIARFYRETRTQYAQLDAFHEDANRQQWTRMIVDVARRSGLDGGLAKLAVDIGAGNGHDLRALRDAGVDAVGVEPSDYQRERMRADGLNVLPRIEVVSPTVLRHADLFVCMDVLEHIDSPDEFLELWCSEARIGAFLVERTPVWDISSPLHLASNRGWHPGRTLEKWGWRALEVDHQTGITVWHRFEEHAPAERTGIVQVIYQGVGIGCYNGMLQLMQRPGWRLPYEIHGDGLIPRGRSMAVTHWWRQTADDVCLMIDSDVEFRPEDVERLAYWCRHGYPVISAAFPLRDGSALGVQPHPTATDNRIFFGADLEPMEIWRIQPGFLAIHRSVLDVLIPTTQLVHETLPTSFWPIFLETIETIERVTANGRPIPPIHTMLSEDWAFSARLNALGIKQYVARDIVLSHGGTVPVSVQNMHLVNQAIRSR
jgi:SAM-dependent methyltransferase